MTCAEYPIVGHKAVTVNHGLDSNCLKEEGGGLPHRERTRQLLKQSEHQRSKDDGINDEVVKVFRALRQFYLGSVATVTVTLE